MLPLSACLIASLNDDLSMVCKTSVAVSVFSAVRSIISVMADAKESAVVVICSRAAAPAARDAMKRELDSIESMTSLTLMLPMQ